MSTEPLIVPASPRAAVRGLVRCAAVLLAALAAGCSGSGEMRFVSLQSKEIDPPTTEVWQFPVQECYWWVDEAGDLNVAMRCPRHNPMLGKYGRLDLDVSFVLDKPPAGSGRNYRIGNRETRTLFASALQNLRLISTSGIVGVTMRDNGVLRGSYRLWMRPQIETDLFAFFPRDPGALLCFGTFQAVKDEKRGRAIRARCESGGWDRGPRPTTRPTSQPAATQPAATQPAPPEAAMPVTAPPSGAAS